MNNPYQSSTMRRMKHRRRALYTLVSLFFLPQWLLWNLRRVLKRCHLDHRVEALFYMLLKPLRAVVGFCNSWRTSRSWKLLWIASPVLLLALLGFTVFFVNANRNRGRAYSGYYQGALEALGDQNFKKADLLFAKLIYHPSYQDNDQVLFRALIAARANGNTTRARALQKKLTVERQYEPAKRWLASNFIEKGAMRPGEAGTLAVMARNMGEQAPDANSARYWRLTLARILMSQSDVAGALEVLIAEKELMPEGRLLRARVYVASGDAEKAKLELRDLVAYLDREDPQDAQYIKERVESFAMLAGLTKDLEESRDLLERALSSVVIKRQLSVNRRGYDAWLGELRVRLFQLLLQSNDLQSRIEAFEYFNQAIAVEAPPYRAGEALNGVVDTASDYTLLSGQMLEVVVTAGGSGAHLAMAMDSWVDGDKERAKMHAGLANAVNPSSLKVLRYAATSSAKRGAPNQLDLNVFKGDNESIYHKSLGLLDLIVEVDFKQSISVAFDKCYIYSLRKNWHGVIELVEPLLRNLEGEQLLQAYDWLVRAHIQLDEEEIAEAYQRTMVEEAAALRGD